MKKTRLLLSTVIAFAMAFGVGVLAVGCNDDPEPTTYTLTYEKGTDEQGAAPEAKKYEAGATVTLAAADTFTKEGYTFTKWLDGTAEYDAGATFTMPEKNVTLKAKWEENEPEPNTDLTKFILGTNIYTLGENAVDGMDLYYEATFTGDPNTNYTFALSYPEEATNHLVSIYLDELDGEEPFADDDTTVLKTSAGGTILFVLFGWTYDADHYNAADETVILTVSKGGILKYNVYFYADMNYANNPMAAKIVPITEGETVNASDIPALLPEEIPDGKEFVGWYIAENAGDDWFPQWTLTDTEFTTETVINSKMVIGAKYEDKVYNNPDAIEVFLGKNNLAINENEVDSTWDGANRSLTFQGEAGNNYTVSLIYPEFENAATVSNVSILLNGTDVSDYIAEDEDSFVLKMPQSGSVVFTLHGMDYNKESNPDLYKLTLQIHGGGTIEYTAAFYADINDIGNSNATSFVTELTVWDGGNISEDDFPTTPQSPSSNLEFGGWFVATPFLNDYEVEYNYGTAVTKDTVFNFMLSNVYIVAKWNYIPPTVTYNNGLSGVNEKTVNVTASELGNPDDYGTYTLTLADATKFTRSNYTLVGWTVIDFMGNVDYDLGEEIEVSAGDTVTIKAKWELNEQATTYSVYFYASFNDLGDNNKLIKTSTVAAGDRLLNDQYPTLTEDQIPAGKKLDSWWRATYNDGESKWEYNEFNDRVDSTTTISKDTYVFPQFKDKPVMPNYPQLNTGVNEIVFTSSDTPHPQYGSQGYYYRYVNLVGNPGDVYTFTVTSATGDGVGIILLKSGTSYLKNNKWCESENGATETFDLEIPEDGWSTITLMANGLDLTHTINIALKGGTAEPASVSLNTLSATAFDDSLTSLPATVNKGETLTVTGDMELTAAEPSTTDGIFVGVSDSQGYALAALNNWVHSQGETFGVAKNGCSFTETLSGAVMDNLNTMFLKKNLN